MDINSNDDDDDVTKFWYYFKKPKDMFVLTEIKQTNVCCVTNHFYFQSEDWIAKNAVRRDWG